MSIEIIWNIPTLIEVILKIRNYFSWDILKRKKKRNQQYHEYDFSDDNGCAHLWSNVLQEDFYLSKDMWKIKKTFETKPARPGDIICINNATISRWVPLLPGQCFSLGVKALDTERKKLIKYVNAGGELEAYWYFETEAKVKSGIASIRVLPRMGCHLLCCSGPLTFSGIPVIVSSSMFSKKLEDGLNISGAVKANIEASLVEIPGEWSAQLRSMVPPELLKRYIAPQYALLIQRITQIKDPSQTAAAAWTGFLCIDARIPSETFKSSIFVVNDQDKAIQEASQRVISYVDFLRSGLIGGSWKTIFNFDEVKKRIPEATFSPMLEPDLMDKAVKDFFKNFL
jgi:hypothetical protein